MSDHHLDGNAATGAFAEAFAGDLSRAEVSCGSCGDAAPFAEQLVYPGGPGTVVRCPSCGEVVARLAHTPGNAWIDLRGSVSWRIPTSMRL